VAIRTGRFNRLMVGLCPPRHSLPLVLRLLLLLLLGIEDGVELEV